MKSSRMNLIIINFVQSKAKYSNAGHFILFAVVYRIYNKLKVTKYTEKHKKTIFYSILFVVFEYLLFMNEDLGIIIHKYSTF